MKTQKENTKRRQHKVMNTTADNATLIRSPDFRIVSVVCLKNYTTYTPTFLLNVSNIKYHPLSPSQESGSFH